MLWLLLWFVLWLHSSQCVVDAAASAVTPTPGVKATITNALNNSQTFVTKLSSPRVMTYNNWHNWEDSRSWNPAWECQLSQRNCYHYDEMHDWGTHNVTVTLEGNVSVQDYPVNYSTAVFMPPKGCAQVYLAGKLVQNTCAYPQFPSGYDASNFDWEEIKTVSSDLDRNYEGGTVDLPYFAKLAMHTGRWVTMICSKLCVLTSCVWNSIYRLLFCLRRIHSPSRLFIITIEMTFRSNWNSHLLTKIM
jgi:hypothetical protein